MSEEQFMVDGGKLRKRLKDWLERCDDEEYNAIAFIEDNLLTELTVPIQPLIEDPELHRRARIEAAIEKLLKCECTKQIPICHLGWASRLVMDFGKWVLGQDQKTWTDKDFGLGEDK